MLIGFGLGNAPSLDHVAHRLETHPGAEHGKLLLGCSSLEQADGIASRIGIGRERDGDVVGADLIDRVVHRGVAHELGTQAQARQEHHAHHEKSFHHCC